MSKKIEIQIEEGSNLVLNYDAIPYPIRRAITGRSRAIYGTQDSDGKWTQNRLINKGYLDTELVKVVLVDRTTTAKKVIKDVIEVDSIGSVKQFVDNLSLTPEQMVEVARELLQRL